MTFAKYVSYETGIRAGFNGGNDVYQWIRKIEGRDFRVYHVKYPRPPEPNIVVLEEVIKNVKEFYFRTFLGNSPPDCADDEEKLFFEQVDGTVSQKYLVSGKNLEKKIIEVVQALERGCFSVKSKNQ